MSNIDFGPSVSYLYELASTANETAQAYRDKELKSATLLLVVNLVERVISRSYSLIPLLDKYESLDVSFGTGLIVRNAAADAVLTIYLHHKIGQNQVDVVEKFANTMLNEGRGISRHFFGVAARLLDNPEMKIWLDRELKDTDDFGRGKGIKSLLSELASQKLGERQKDALLMFYDTYLMFSKLEHFGHETKIVELMEEERLKALFIHRIYTMALHLSLLHDVILLLTRSAFALERQKVVGSFLDRVNSVFDKWSAENRHLLSPH